MMVVLAADGQKLSVVSRPETIISGSRGALRLRFQFDSEWDGWRACAVFGDDAVPVVDGECTVPDSATDGNAVKLRLVGGNGNARMSTNAVSIKQKEA